MAFEYASFATRNPAHVTKHWRKQWSTRKALLAHKKANPACALTGDTRKTQVHHRVPVSISPERAGDPTNLVTLRKDVHWLIGHGGRNWKNYTRDIDMAISILKNLLLETKAHDEK